MWPGGRNIFQTALSPKSSDPVKAIPLVADAVVTLCLDATVSAQKTRFPVIGTLAATP